MSTTRTLLLQSGREVVGGDEGARVKLAEPLLPHGQVVRMCRLSLRRTALHGARAGHSRGGFSIAVAPSPCGEE